MRFCTSAGLETSSSVTLTMTSPALRRFSCAAELASTPVITTPFTASLILYFLRNSYKIKDAVKGVVITGVDANSAAQEKRLNAGDVIVKVTDEEVSNPADVQKRIDQLKKDGKKTALLLVANAEGD